MDADSSRGIVDWHQLGHRLRRPIFWLILAGTLVGVAAGALARPAFDPKVDDPNPNFRFDEVYVVEESAHGNFTKIRIVPWVSNPSRDATKSLQLVVHVIGPRNLVQNVTTLDLHPPRARNTVTGAATFTINNTQTFRIEILALVDGLLAAKGFGNVGFQPAYEYDAAGLVASARTLVAGDFQYDYGRT